MFILKRKKKMVKNHSVVLENLCDKIVDVVGETFTKKYYLVKISQTKRGHIYLTARKRRGRLLWEEKQALHRKINEVTRSVFHWFSEENKFIDRHYFMDFEVLKECSSYHFYYLLISRDNISTNIFLM